jgi:uncharacterized membrane protein
MPNQKHFNALSNEDRAKVTAIAQRYLYWTAFGVLLLFATVQFSVYETALGAGSVVGPAIMVLSIVIVLAIVAGALRVGVLSSKQVEELYRAAETKRTEEQNRDQDQWHGQSQDRD